MKVYHLKRTQFFDRPLKKVFSFFEQPENLERITPKSLQFEILSPKPILMKKGALIDYSIKICGVRCLWQTEITKYNPPHEFQDIQLKGPYKMWHHSHFFEETDKGTRMTDEVDYAIGYGVFGTLANILFVKRQLKQIFDYRAHVIETLLH